MSSQEATQHQYFLDNNAQILDIEPGVGVVFAKQNSTYHPYVVWAIYRKDEDKTNCWRCYSGEYFIDLNDAAINYQDRVAVLQRKESQSRLAQIV